MTVRLRTDVDGFNLYYRALRHTRFKWLNLQALTEALLGQDHEILCIRYFTAPVSGKRDPGQPVRRQRYLDALRSLPCVSIHLGSFLTRPKMRPLVQPAPDGPTHVLIENSEEKGSDVNLATYLIHMHGAGCSMRLLFSRKTRISSNRSESSATRSKSQ